MAQGCYYKSRHTEAVGLKIRQQFKVSQLSKLSHVSLLCKKHKRQNTVVHMRT